MLAAKVDHGTCAPTAGADQARRRQGLPEAVARHQARKQGAAGGPHLRAVRAGGQHGRAVRCPRAGGQWLG